MDTAKKSVGSGGEKSDTERTAEGQEKKLKKSRRWAIRKKGKSKREGNDWNWWKVRKEKERKEEGK